MKWPAHDQALRSAQAAAVRAWREFDADLTREELAARLAISVRSVQRIESGEVSIRTDVVHAMEQIHPGIVRRLFPATAPTGRRP